MDSDGDLLPDEWEQQYFSSTTGALPDDDPDGDRLTNLDERFAGTDPTAHTSAASLSENQLLRFFQGKAFLFFWEQSEPPYFLTHDNAHYDGTNGSQNFNSNAAVGFSFAAYAVADQNDWVKHTDAYERIRTALARLVELQGASYDMIGVPLTQQGNRHGLTYHFMDNNGFRAFSNVEISTIDHALLTAGALLAASYYPGTEVEDLAHQLFDNTDWSWLYDGNVFYQGWLEGCALGDNCIEGGHTLDAWNRYSELMILLFQTMSAGPLKGVDSHAWEYLSYGQPVMFPNEWVDISPGSNPQNFTFLPDMPDVSQAAGFENNSGHFRYIHAGSIHNHQYSHMFADFRRRPDGFRQTDFFANSINATMANREFCIQLNAHAFGGDPGSPDPFLQQPYETYGPNSWGLLAGIVSDGTYKVMQPIVVSWDNFSPENIAANNDSGTVFLPAPLGSTAFTPREVIDFARNILTRFQANQPDGFNALVNRYGFMNSFNLGRGFYRDDPPGHFSVVSIGIDLGAAVGGIENHLTGLPWKLSMRQSRVTDGMANGAGFNVGNVEPFILNFDDNPPAPSEDTNGGGQDPNSFGAGMFEFGTGASIQYVFIGDPRPDIPYGPQDWAAEIQTIDNVNDGGFILLNAHSVSHWDRVSFWIKGDGAGQDFAVGLKDSIIDYKGTPLQATEIKLPIKDFFPSGEIPADWTELRIPLAEFETRGVRLTRLDNISFTNLRPGGGRIWVDDIAFLGDEFPPAAPENVQVLVENDTDVRISWNENTERDVVGYNVYRRIPGALDFMDPLNDKLVVGTNYLIPNAAYQTYEYAVTAVDNASPQNESDFSNLFFWTVHHDISYIPTETYSSAASAKMILNYLGAPGSLSQTDIYNYGHPLNLPPNSGSGTELDAKGMDAVLGHFDPYDSSVTTPYDNFDALEDGNPFQGYNFGVEVWNSNQMQEYLRDLAHWMDYEVPLYSGSNQFTNPSRVPPAVPLFGSYADWVVVNGYAASADPLPNPNNPWFTPDFMVYGFWITDPNVNGIGSNHFVTAQVLSSTYFLPMVTGDIYNGKLIQVAEPPRTKSRAKTKIADFNRRRLNAEALGAVGEEAWFLNEDNHFVNDLSRKRKKARLSLASIRWERFIPEFILKDKEFAEAYQGSRPAKAILVKSKRYGDYYIVAFTKSSKRWKGKFLTSAAVILDRKTGVFHEASWTKEPVTYLESYETEAVAPVLKSVSPLAAARASRFFKPAPPKMKAELVWEPGNSISSSPFQPYLKITAKGFLTSRRLVRSGSR